MRHVSGVVLGAALSVAAAASVQAAPVAVLTMPYTIGSLSQALQFMGDGSVRICDGSVRVVCDGSVRPVVNASVAVSADGSVRLATPIALLGDGTASTSVSGIVGDAIVLNSLLGSPNPMVSFGAIITDAGTPTTFTIAGPFDSLNLGGGNDYSYLLSGSAALADGRDDGVTLTPGTLGTETGIVFAIVDGVVIDAAGGPLSGNGTTVPLLASGTGTCVTCGGFGLFLSFTGSGGNDVYTIVAELDLEPVSVPAPAPAALLAVGLLGLALVRRRA